MSKIDELIQQYCPDGVEYVKLNELGSFYSGLSGKSKEDFRDGNAKFITYVNIFNNPALNTDVEDKVKIAEGEKQNTIQYGDLLFTGSSETPDECGMCSVLTHHTDEHLYLNSFCFGFRFNDLSDKTPDFMKHLFRSSSIRKDICKTANGVTRYNISKKEFAKIEIPLPPLPVQEAIVNILDRFAVYAAELQAELQARQQQYNYYRDTLLSFEGREDVQWKKLGDVCIYAKERIGADLVDENNYVSVENLLPNQRGKEKASNVPKEGNCIKFEPNDVLVGNIRPYLHKIWYADCVGGTNGDVLCIRIKDDAKKIIPPRYLYCILSSHSFFEYDNSYSKGAKMPRGDKQKVMEYEFGIPSLSEQQRIVNILDRFDRLINDLSQGLPAEIEARQQQYEYYRDQLLTFKRKEA